MSTESDIIQTVYLFQYCQSILSTYWTLLLLEVLYKIYIYDLVPKGVHENRTKGVENKVDDTLKLVVFLECAQC